MSIKEYYVYLDESGGAGLDFSKKGTSSYFIISSVIVEREKKQLLCNGAKGISSKFFQGSTIKSSKVKTIDRRLSILEEIAKLDCHFYAIVVHKRKLNEISQGYSFHDPFFKNLHGKMERELLRTFPYVSIVAHQHGDDEFMLSFKKRIQLISATESPKLW